MSICCGCESHLNSLIRAAGLLLRSWLLLLPLVCHGQAGPALSLDDAVATALEHSPALAGLRAEADAIRTLPSQEAALPDPVLSLNAMNMPVDTFDFDQEPMTQMQIALSQRFPFPGKRKLRRQAAEYRAGASAAMFDEGRSLLLGRVKMSWWRLLNMDRALQIVEQNKELMRNFVEIAHTKYKVGDGLQQDVLLAQLELSRLLDRELRLRGSRRGAQAELNALMNRPADRTIQLPAAPPDTRLPELPAEQLLLQRAGAERALIEVQRGLVDAARARLDVAKKDRLPDFRLGVGYGFRQGIDPLRATDRPDLLTVMLSVDVPLYSGSKQKKAVEQRTHEVSRQQYIFTDTLRSVEASVSRNLADYRAARDQVALLESAIIPQAQQTVSSMLAGYRVNQVDFMNLVNTQITLYNAQIDYWESLSGAKQALAGLAAAVGTEALYE